MRYIRFLFIYLFLSPAELRCTVSPMFCFLDPSMCQNHMVANMDPSNCVGLYHWARDLGAAGLADCALRYIYQHFAEVGIEYN